MNFASPLEQAKARLDVIAVAAAIFPGWKASKSCRSPFREDRNASFSVYDDGRKWKDHATGDGGDLIDFLAMARGISKADAARELIAMAGTGTGPRSSPSPRIATAPRAPSVPAPAVLAPMPQDCRDIWNEGVDHLHGNASLQDVIDKWRSWPAGTVRTLAADGLMACPIVYGKRTTAFAVQAPYLDELGLVSTRDVGFHVRHKPPAGERATWSYQPSCPALPFVIGGGFVPFARTIIVTEGQWDAVTLASAAGWLTTDAAWPERVALFGTRGAGGWRQLIDAWRSYWLPAARFVLFADADKGGDSWTAPGGFARTLAKLGHRVRIGQSTEAGAKDLNDLHRAQPITPELVTRWLTPAQTEGKTT